MSFSAATCLSYTGTTTLTNPITIYSNTDSYSSPFTSITLNQITSGNCPLMLTGIPDGTTTIRLKSANSYCCDIILECNDLCTTCDLQFTSISDNEIGTIYVGNLTGSCDTTIDNYRISWYGPNSPTTLAFTSGYGPIWSHDANHPITSSSLDSPLLLPGEYVSKITEVELNGVRFSYTGGTNNVLSPDLINCSTGTTVDPYTCDNGGYINPPYAHTKTYTTDGSSIPKSLSTEYLLSANTEYFIWSLQTFSIYDTLTLVFSGSSYSELITLENIKLGGDAGATNLNPTSFPKVWNRDSPFKKITVLTGLTVNEADKMIINVTPNPDNNVTSWDLKFGCYSNPTASKTCLDSYKNSPYKIKKSSILSNMDTCGNISITFDVSGCSVSENSSFFSSDLASLTSRVESNGFPSTDNITKLVNIPYDNLSFGNDLLTYSGETLLPIVCMNSGNNTISITKSDVTGYNFFFSNIDDLTAYYTGFTSASSIVKSRNYGTGTFVNDNTNLNYYRFVGFRYPVNTGNYMCGDGLISAAEFVHCDANCTTGTTSGGYTMFLETPEIINNYTCTPCLSSCPIEINQWIGRTQSTRLTIFATQTNISGLRYRNPFPDIYGLRIQSPTPRLNSTVQTNLFVNPTYSTNTYASSGITNTLIPSLSGTSWDWENHFYTYDFVGQNYQYYLQDVFYYKVVITSPSKTDPLTFKIFAYPIVNFKYDSSGGLIEVYDSTNPSGSNPIYVY